MINVMSPKAHFICPSQCTHLPTEPDKNMQRRVCKVEDEGVINRADNTRLFSTCWETEWIIFKSRSPVDGQPNFVNPINVT